MGGVIQKDCYWRVDGNKMMAFCLKCADKTGWFWQGSSQGYGDYDLKCSKCGDSIHIRETNE